MGRKTVDELLAERNHPLATEVQAVRRIIKGVDERITEEWKWSAPSFSYKGYLVTFNLHATDRVHLVFHNGAILDDQGGLLEGDYPDRRMAYLTDMRDVKAKAPRLRRAIQEWIRLRDA
jgi:hypothetical protein